MVDCVNDIMETIGPDSSITRADVEDIVAEAEIEMARLRSENDVPVSVGMKKWLEEKRVDAKENAEIARRNAAFDSLARSEMLHTVKRLFPKGKEQAEGVRSLIVGDGFRSEISADSVKVNAGTRWADDLLFGIQSLGDDAFPTFKSGVLDENIADALFLIERKENGKITPEESQRLSKIDDMSKNISRVILDSSEAQRLELNDAGAHINKREGHLWRASHDADKITKVGFDGWWDGTRDLLDYFNIFGKSKKQMLGNAESAKLVDDIAKEWYSDLSTGTRVSETTPSAVRGGNLAKKISQSRRIIFSGGREFFAYQKQFGVGNISDALYSQIRSNATSMGMLRKLGTNPEANIRSVIETLKEIAEKNNDSAAKTALGSASFNHKWKRELDDLSGANTPVQNIVGTAFKSLRWLQSVTKLSLSALSAAADPANMMANARMLGRGPLSGISEALDGLFATKTPKGMQKEVARSTGIALDVSRAGIADLWDTTGSGPGKMAKSLEVFFKWSGLTGFTNSMKKGHIVGESSWLAEMSGRNFKDLDIGTQRALQSGNMGELEWNVIRKANKNFTEGNHSLDVITPEAIKDLDDSLFVTMLDAQGKSTSKIAVNRARKALEENLSGYYLAQSASAVIEPNARTQSMITQGSRDGTPVGIFWRTINQFRSFPIAVWQQRVKKDIQSRTGNRFNFGKETFGKDALTSWAPAMSEYIFMTSMFGYVAMTLKDVAKGNTPRDPLDPKTMIAAMLQGGGLGIWGDFLFGEMKNRFGGNPITSALGPTAGTLAGIGDIYGRIKGNVLGENNDVLSSAIRLGYNNTPFVNLPYIKMPLDYFLMERIFEELNPGQGQRRKDNKFKQTGQQSFLPVAEGF